MEKHKPKERWLKPRDIRLKQRYNIIQERKCKEPSKEQLWKWIKESEEKAY